MKALKKFFKSSTVPPKVQSYTVYRKGEDGTYNGFAALEYRMVRKLKDDGLLEDGRVLKDMKILKCVKDFHIHSLTRKTNTPMCLYIWEGDIFFSSEDQDDGLRCGSIQTDA